MDAMQPSFIRDLCEAGKNVRPRDMLSAISSVMLELEVQENFNVLLIGVKLLQDTYDVFQD